MKLKNVLLGLSYLISFMSYLKADSQGVEFLDHHIKRHNYGVEIVHLIDNDLPTFDLFFYFDRGALYDPKGLEGLSALTLQALDLGTLRYKRVEIADHMEFLSASMSSNVTHEYASLSLKGLSKEFSPSVKMMCHMLDKATYSASELKNLKQQIEKGFQNIVSNHGALADRAARKISLQGTSYEYEAQGNLRSIKRIKTRHLKNSLKALRGRLKRIYVRGPKSLEARFKMLTKDCHFEKTSQKELSLKTELKIDSDTIHLIKVDKATQAQVRLVKYLKQNKQFPLNSFDLEIASGYLGGGFTSRLMTVLRVENGLTYSANAVAAYQRDYGRAVISTFTKNLSITPLLQLIEKTINEDTQLSTEEMTRFKNKMIGNDLFGLENQSLFLTRLMMLDHQKRKYQEIYDFKNYVLSKDQEQLKKDISQIFSNMVTVIVGDKKLEKMLKKTGYIVKTHKAQSFL